MKIKACEPNEVKKDIFAHNRITSFWFVGNANLFYYQMIKHLRSKSIFIFKESDSFFKQFLINNQIHPI